MTKPQCGDPDRVCTCGAPTGTGSAVWVVDDDTPDFDLCGDCLRQMLADYGPDPDRIEENLTAADWENFDAWDAQMGVGAR